MRLRAHHRYGWGKHGGFPSCGEADRTPNICADHERQRQPSLAPAGPTIAPCVAYPASTKEN